VKKLITIFRTYAGETDGNLNPVRPDWFSKYACLNSVVWEFRQTEDCELHLIWDGDPTETCDYLEEIKKQRTISITKIHYPGKLGNKGAVDYSYKLLEELEGEYCYLCEDDHLHRKSAKNVLLSLFHRSPLACLYDNPDRYNNIGLTDITLGKEYIMWNDDVKVHARTAESTVQTFGVSKDVFMKFKETFYKHLNDGIGAPNDRPLFKSLIFNGLRLVTPIPSYATHVVKGGLAPGVDWESISEKAKNTFLI